MKPRFNLVKSKQTHIRLIFRYSGSRLVYYPGIQINQSDWNAKTQRIRKGCKDWQEINGALDRLHDFCLTIYRAHLASGELLPTDLFKLKLDREFKGIRSMDESQTLSAYILKFAAAKERGGQMKGGTTKHYRPCSRKAHARRLNTAARALVQPLSEIVKISGIGYKEEITLFRPSSPLAYLHKSVYVWLFCPLNP